jgi:hypothetical protein
MINRAFFFERCRGPLFGGVLRQKQVEGHNIILDEWERNHARKDDRWLAYALATTCHETARTMQPIHERGGRNYFHWRYDIEGANPALARRLGNISPGDGVLFRGRGYVQLTGRANYERMGRLFDVDLTSGEAAADRALEPALACGIMFAGMEGGLFTGKKFEDYFHGWTQDWRGARRIINGLDRADLVADHARDYYAAISYYTSA